MKRRSKRVLRVTWPRVTRVSKNGRIQYLVDGRRTDRSDGRRQYFSDPSVALECAKQLADRFPVKRRPLSIRRFAASQGLSYETVRRITFIRTCCPDLLEWITKGKVSVYATFQECHERIGRQQLAELVAEQSPRWDKEHRPTGTYRPDGIIPLSETARIEMCLATRAHLLQWQAIETDPRNLTYIESRLALYGSEHKNLEELEREKFGFADYGPARA